MDRHLAAGQKERVSSMFGRIAGRYDLANTVLSMGLDRTWRRRASRALLSELRRRTPGDASLRVLDFCAGTGAQAVSLVREAAREGRRVRVVASDLALPMLRVFTRRRATGGGWAKHGAAVLPIHADAESPPVLPGRLDGAVVSFGIRNVDRYPLSLAAVKCALRPAGVLAVLEFSMPEQEPLRTAYRLYFRRVLPFLGRLFFDASGAYAYLPSSVSRFPTGADFEAVMRRAGLAPLRTISLSGGIVTLYLAERPGRPTTASHRASEMSD